MVKNKFDKRFGRIVLTMRNVLNISYQIYFMILTGTEACLAAGMMLFTRTLVFSLANSNASP